MTDNQIFERDGKITKHAINLAFYASNKKIENEILFSDYKDLTKEDRYHKLYNDFSIVYENYYIPKHDQLDDIKFLKMYKGEIIPSAIKYFVDLIY